MILSYLSVISFLSLLEYFSPVSFVLNADTPFEGFGPTRWGVFVCMVVIVYMFVLKKGIKRGCLSLGLLNILIITAWFLGELSNIGWVVVATVMGGVWGYLIYTISNGVSLTPSSALSKLVRLAQQNFGIIGATVLTLFLCLFATYTYYSFQYPIWDLGLFHEAVAHISRGEAPAIASRGLAHIFQDHFNPLLYAYAVPYKLIPSALTLLYTQALIIGASGFLIWDIILIQRGRKMAALMFLIYSLFFGFQHVMGFGFYPEMAVILGFALFYWLIAKEKLSYIWVTLLPLLLGKENGGIYVFALGIWLVLIKRLYVKGTLFAMIGIIWLLTATLVVIPQYSPDGYHHSALPFEGGARDNIGRVLSNPFSLIGVMGTPVQKVETYILTFAPFFFLPLLSLNMLFIILPILGERFIPDAASRWGIGFHYSAVLGVPIVLGVVEGLAVLKDKIGEHTKANVPVLLGLMVLITSMAVTLRMPFIAVRDMRSNVSQIQENMKVLAEIQPLLQVDSTILAVNAIGPMLSGDHAVAMFNRHTLENTQADYVILAEVGNIWPNVNDDIIHARKQFRESERYREIYLYKEWSVFEKRY